jgi:hypothetical protein
VQTHALIANPQSPKPRKPTPAAPFIKHAEAPAKPTRVRAARRQLLRHRAVLSQWSKAGRHSARHASPPPFDRRGARKQSNRIATTCLSREQ